MKSILQLAAAALIAYLLTTAPHASAALLRDGGHAVQHVAAGVRSVVQQLSGQKG